MLNTRGKSVKYGGTKSKLNSKVDGKNVIIFNLKP